MYLINVQLNLFLTSDGKNGSVGVRTLLKEKKSMSNITFQSHQGNLTLSVFNYRNPSVGITVKYLQKERKRDMVQ